MKKLLAMFPLMLVALSCLSASATDEPAKKTGAQKDQASVWMKEKLSASQLILAGLTRADYPAIEQNASAMLTVTHLEKWVRADTPNYKSLMDDFQFANKSLVVAAKEKNLDAATIAYFQMTISCVNCHKIVRGDKL